MPIENIDGERRSKAVHEAVSVMHMGTRWMWDGGFDVVLGISVGLGVWRAAVGRDSHLLFPEVGCLFLVLLG